MDSCARDTQGRSPCTSSKNAAHMGTSVPSTVAFSSAGGVPLELLAPTHRSAFLVWVVRLHGFSCGSAAAPPTQM
ncbi:unnamed protein product [Staurois parvus]|uniref:Uncharacterized protein n=1 Tax=Staurois parvus TaxID=386267 RepID=A0ABN9CJB9_9NEOB|nr:unnamed protein product [Staurois parvus]